MRHFETHASSERANEVSLICVYVFVYSANCFQKWNGEVHGVEPITATPHPNLHSRRTLSTVTSICAVGVMRQRGKALQSEQTHYILFPVAPVFDACPTAPLHEGSCMRAAGTRLPPHKRASCLRVCAPK